MPFLLLLALNLDISLLQSAVEELRLKSNQLTIQVFRPETITNNCYCVCALCKSDIRVKTSPENPSRYHSSDRIFVKIPVRSYANGLWTGDVPDALKGLTFFEEQCIAHARITKCMFKLQLGPSGQYASKGNVCIFPQDPSPLATSLPLHCLSCMMKFV